MVYGKKINNQILTPTILFCKKAIYKKKTLWKLSQQL